MFKKNKVIAIIPARGGSRGIKRKNMINFCGKPLIYWTINQCVKSKLIQDVWVSSDKKEILLLYSSVCSLNDNFSISVG